MYCFQVDAASSDEEEMYIAQPDAQTAAMPTDLEPSAAQVSQVSVLAIMRLHMVDYQQ